MVHGIERHTIDGLEIAVLRRGTDRDGSEPLIFLHGLGDSAILTFEPIATHSALAHRSAVLIDLAGFGHSIAPDDWPATMEAHADMLVTLLNAIGVHRSTIIGHSMGASLALMVAARQPAKVPHLILAEPLLLREQSELAASLARRSEHHFVSQGINALHRATRRQAARGDLAALGFLTPLQHANPAIMHRSACSLLTDRSPSFLTLLTTLTMKKTLLIGSRTEADISVVPADVHVIRIPGAGHSMMSENPHGFALAIASALAHPE